MASEKSIRAIGTLPAKASESQWAPTIKRGKIKKRAQNDAKMAYRVPQKYQTNKTHLKRISA